MVERAPLVDRLKAKGDRAVTALCVDLKMFTIEGRGGTVFEVHSRYDHIRKSAARVFPDGSERYAMPNWVIHEKADGKLIRRVRGRDLEEIPLNLLDEVIV